MTACIEKKLTLSGRTDLFQCELLELIPGRGVLRYVLEHGYTVAGIRLLPGDVTYGLYWTDRPYTLYRWHTRDRGRQYYFNIADSVSLSPELFVWRDLTVDILVDDRLSPQVLDEDELPRDMPAALGATIQEGRNLVLSRCCALIQESEAILSSITAAARHRAGTPG